MVKLILKKCEHSGARVTYTQERTRWVRSDQSSHVQFNCLACKYIKNSTQHPLASVQIFNSPSIRQSTMLRLVKLTEDDSQISCFYATERRGPI